MTDQMGAFLGAHAKPLRPADEKAARAAMGIPDEASVIPMDMTRAPLFVIAQETDSGSIEVTTRATMHPLQAASLLHQIAATFEQRALVADDSKEDQE